MRYAHGILIGATLPGVIFTIAAAIKIAGIGADAAAQEALWNIYVIWFLVSIAIVILLPLFIYFIRRSIFRQFLIYEAGGLGLFSPLWLIALTDISGTPWYTIFTDGLDNALIGFDPAGNIQGIAVSNLFLIPVLIVSVILGLIFLRPSFIEKYSSPSDLPEIKKTKTPPVLTEDESMEVDMPEINAPTPTVDSVASLRDILVEMDIQEPTINLILNSGIGTTIDLVGTSPDQLAAISKLDKRTAESIILAVQKKLWFSDI